MSKLFDLIRRKGLRRTLRYSVHWASEKYHERRFGIDSAGYISLSDLGFAELDATCGAYEPISYRDIFTALRQLDLTPDRDVFLDYGSGKGRAVIAAATFPFKRVIGVELSEDLNCIARENAARAQHKLRCRDVQILTANALEYEPPDDLTVVLMNNPFTLEMMQQVSEKICASLARTPRTLHVIFRYPYWAIDPFADDARFIRVFEHRGYSEVREKVRVYRYRAADAV